MARESGFSDDEWRVWRAYVSSRGQLARALDRQLQRDSGISQADFSILAAIFEAPDRRLRVGQIADALAWEKSRVSHQVSRMESRELLQRSDCDLDGRGTWIEMTAEGSRTVLGAMRAHSAEVRRLFLGLLSPEQQAMILDVSQRVLDELNPESCDELDAAADADARALAAASVPV